jgi:nitrogen-specific signal transduction histidine kinase
MMVEGVEYLEKRYVRIGISNNGNPLPADFSLSDFVSRGVVGINSSQDGLGGDHIHKIVNNFGGLVSIESEPEWLTFNVLLPVYLTSNDTKFIEYECECV